MIDVQRLTCDAELEPELKGALQKALQIVEERLTRVYGEVPELDLDSIDVDLPRGVPAATLPTLIADAISVSIQRQLAGAGIVKVDYGGASKRSRAKLPERKPSLLARVKAGLGLGGGKGVEITHSPRTPELLAQNAELAELYQAYCEARVKTPAFRAALEAHLGRHGIAYRKAGSSYVLRPLRQGHQLNVLAWGAKERLGIHCQFSPEDRRQGRAYGSFSRESKVLEVDTMSILHGIPSSTFLHELHHGYLYQRIDDQRIDSFINLRMRSVNYRGGQNPLASTTSYEAKMSNQELSTFGRQLRTIVAYQLKKSKVFDQEFQTQLRQRVWGVQGVSTNAIEVPDKLIPQLDRFLSGQDSFVKISLDKQGELEVRVWDTSGRAGLHHGITLHTATPEIKRLAKKSDSPESQREIATLVRGHLETTRLVGQALHLIAGVVGRELEKLPVGVELDAEMQRRLRDLTAWPGYILRVGEDPELSTEERRAELERQIELAKRVAA